MPPKQQSKARKAEEPKQWEVEEIVDHRWIKHDKKQYLLKWKNCDASENTWEDESGMNCPELLKAYLKTPKAMEIDADHQKELEEAGTLHWNPNQPENQRKRPSSSDSWEPPHSGPKRTEKSTRVSSSAGETKESTTERRSSGQTRNQERSSAEPPIVLQADSNSLLSVESNHEESSIRNSENTSLPQVHSPKHPSDDDVPEPPRDAELVQHDDEQVVEPREPQGANEAATDEVVIAADDDQCQLEKGATIERVMAAGEYNGIRIIKLKYHGIAKPEWVDLDTVNQFNPQAVIDAYKNSIPGLQQDEICCNGEPI